MPIEKMVYISSMFLVLTQSYIPSTPQAWHDEREKHIMSYLEVMIMKLS